MSQYAFSGNTIINQSFPDTRTALNAAYAALASNSSGDNDPTSVAGGSLATVQHQWWYDSTNNKLMLRNDANNAWIEIATIDETSGNVLSITTQGLTIGATALTATGTEINQLSTITRGSILYGDSSGATARLAAGGADTVLTSDGTDISWSSAGGGGGAYNLLQTVTSSDDATVSVGNSSLITATYSVYEIHVTGLIPATDNAILRGRMEIGGSIISASNYNYWTLDVNSSATTTPVRSATSVTFFEVVTNMDNPSSGAVNFVLRFYNPTSTALLKTWDYSGSSKDTNLTRMKLITGAAGYNDGTAALTGYNFFASSGNITSGVFKLYGIA